MTDTDRIVDTTDQWETIAVHPITPGLYGELEGPHGTLYVPLVAILEQKNYLTLVRRERTDGTQYSDDQQHQEHQAETRFTPGHIDSEGELLPVVEAYGFSGVQHQSTLDANEQCRIGICYF